MLLVTIAALALAVWRLSAELVPLRVENRRLRNGVGELTVEDESLLHAIKIEQPDDYTWKWRVWIPKGRAYRLHYQTSLIGQSGAGQSSATITMDDPGEHWIEYRIRRDRDSGKWMDELATEQGTVGSSQQDWIDWPQKTSTSEGVGRRTESFPTGVDVLLIRRRVSQASSSDQIENPSAGFMIWLEAVP